MKPETLARYGNRQIPRYTSYPTAPCFSAAVDEQLYRLWLAAIPRASELSLYLHIPFCRSMCWYCGCHTTVTARQTPISRYMDALCREISIVANALPDRMPVRHVHFGGGTPTIMTPDEMLNIMAQIGSRFDLAKDAEIAIEIDPRTLSSAMIAALAASGVNRVSIGIQSFDPEVQSAINRIQPFTVAEKAVRELRASGITNINFDLIYGLPRQTVASCLDTVEKAILLNPDRLAVFGYAHVPGFKLHQRKIDEALLPTNTARIEQSHAIAEALTQAGYIQIGLDHFARPEDSLAIAAKSGALHRNFQGYTTDNCPVLLGFGASSISRLPDGYTQNAVLISDYQQRIANGRLPIARGCAISPEDSLRATVIERLMCDYRVDLAEVCARFRADPVRLAASANLAPLARDGLIVLSGDSIEITPSARPLVRAVAAAFDQYLDESQGKHARAV